MYERFPTQAEKDFRDGKISKMPSTPLYKYWTNFDRSNPKEFEVKQEQITNTGPNLIDNPGWWWQFTTNIEPTAFEYEWDEKRQRRFLYKMDAIYNLEKVEVK